MGKRRGFLLLALASLAALAGACMWDSDTLAEEAKGKMDLVGTIVGRFDQNPPAYYEMRIKRETGEVAANPSKLELYDDLGVAEERLSRHDDAIAWMAKKKAAMKPLDMKSQASKDAWYRYHANLGTFLAHRGLDRTGEHKPGDLEQARGHLREAIRINPNAHFGREVVQLDILNWMGDFETNRFEGPLGDYLWETHEKEYRGREKELRDKLIEGLAGLVRLGNAWQSVDVFAALRSTLSLNGDGNLASLANFRVKELIASGKRSYGTAPGDEIEGWHPMPDDVKFNEKEYKRLREEAEQHRKSRQEYMQARLDHGKHPDTDPHFWDDFREGATTEINSPGFFASPNGRMWGTMTIAVGLLCLLPLALLIFAMIRLWARKR